MTSKVTIAGTRLRPLVRRWRQRRKVAKLAVPVRKAVNRLIRNKLELKEAVSSNAVTQFTGDFNGVVFEGTSYVGQGNTVSQRIGEKITASQLTFRYLVFPGTAFDNIRVIGFIWRANVDSTAATNVPVAADILDPNLLGINYFGSIANYNVNQRENYHIFYDRMHTNNSNYSGATNWVSGGKVVNLKNMPIYFVGTTNTSASAGRNHIYFLFVSSTTTDFTAQMVTHLRYRDG